MQGRKLRDVESAGKAEYGKLLTAEYWDFTHVIPYAFHLSTFQSVPHRRAMSVCICVLNFSADQSACLPINVPAVLPCYKHDAFVLIVQLCISSSIQ